MNRRRLLALMATVPSFSGCRSRKKEGYWQGSVFNSPANIRYEGLSAVPPEIEQRIVQLSDILSLYQPDSALSVLNREGRLSHPPEELVRLLQQCQELHQASHGLFDPTIQSYWRWLNEENQKGRAPPAEEREKALELVDYGRVEVSAEQIVLHGTQLTLNAVAQGFATDEITSLLKKLGAQSALVNLGEYRAFGKKYAIQIRHPDSRQRVLRTVSLRDEALAVSSGSGHRLSATGPDNHILSPGSGQSPPASRTTAVVAPTATTADGWATILSLKPELENKLPPHCRLA
ncbi:FAD:protein FMN transferase [Roseibacillus persicicus]|uniref:FAD:protein FMN transferase n=1 Tax=Roseibacillus persicicus TaxID=454148 RepID=UPI00280EFF78|nr:FAD:protein FMN transferase [Roseibacillus persicicus]MDQ8191656.1 FAD:protein FMN transferase [Roseibacillus persicicus]